MDRNYEQEYKKAFEAAKGLHEAGNALTKQQMEIVFPQLAESEDERIRKWIANYIHRGVFDEEEHPKALKAVEWLEKQKEQKKSLSERFRPDFPAVADFIESVDELEKNWSEEDNIGWDEAFACVTKTERAAKDEGELQNAVTAEKWLKEIKFKYCVHPQSKQEWSEEDRLHYANVLEALEYVKGCKSDYDKVEAVKSDIAWIKSLRHQPHWKPSEEQMKALLKVVDKARELHYSSNSGYDEYDVLRLLYEQLKKL